MPTEGLAWGITPLQGALGTTVCAHRMPRKDDLCPPDATEGRSVPTGCPRKAWRGASLLFREPWVQRSVPTGCPRKDDLCPPDATEGRSVPTGCHGRTVCAHRMPRKDGLCPPDATEGLGWDST
ncbi:hypothetical protein NDU88_000139 [Pleurodeles waltl]|uniref:Uncharacterized protein n=1 Tax=Pleurodeles waltl TaxID=8319 RepID=A0AAV7V856_PLEWA|nr:hypothetical protein NDU88_000139 [Pleurodeles waltl]